MICSSGSGGGRDFHFGRDLDGFLSSFRQYFILSVEKLFAPELRDVDRRSSHPPMSVSKGKWTLQDVNKRSKLSMIPSSRRWTVRDVNQRFETAMDASDVDEGCKKLNLKFKQNVNSPISLPSNISRSLPSSLAL